VESFILGVVPARKPLILVRLIVAEIISYIVIFLFLCDQQFKSFT